MSNRMPVLVRLREVFHSLLRPANPSWTGVFPFSSMEAADGFMEAAHPSLVVVDLESVLGEPRLADIVRAWRGQRPNMLVVFVSPVLADSRLLALLNQFATDERIHLYTFAEMHSDATWTGLMRHTLSEQLASTVGGDFHRLVLARGLSIAAYNTVRLLVDLAPTCSNVADAERDARLAVFATEGQRTRLRNRLQRAGQLRAKTIILSARLVYYVWLKQQGKPDADIAQAMHVTHVRQLTESLRRSFDVNTTDLGRVRYQVALEWLVEDCLATPDPDTTAERLLAALAVRGQVSLRKGRLLAQIAAVFVATFAHISRKR